MRTVAVAIGLLVIYHPAAAQDRRPQTGSSEASSSQITTGQESEARAAERKKVEDAEKARQRRVDRLGRSICTGC